MLANKEAIFSASRLVQNYIHQTPQICWPLLSNRCGAEVWIKHENHSPIGSFKLRGGLTYIDGLKRRQPSVSGVITATRGNHGQSVALAARTFDIRSEVVVPYGNSLEKNAAMQAFGAKLIEYGRDFDEAMEFAQERARAQKLNFVPSFDYDLVAGVGTYTAEFLSAIPDLEVIYVPIGLGSGVCGAISAREALGSKVDVIGVVAAEANSYALSFEAGKAMPTNSANTFADGLAVRVPDSRALETILDGVERVVTVSEKEIKDAIRYYYTDTHNLAEGAGAASLAAFLQERQNYLGRKVGIVFSGGNIDLKIFREIVSGDET